VVVVDDQDARHGVSGLGSRVSGGEMRGALPFLDVATTFQDLDVYRRAVAFADELHDLVLRWPKLDRWTVGIQLIRAADSVGATSAEARGRWPQAARRRLLSVARGSLAETEHWVLRAEERGLLPRGRSERLSDIRRPLNGLIKKSRPG